MGASSFGGLRPGSLPSLGTSAIRGEFCVEKLCSQNALVLQAATESWSEYAGLYIKAFHWTIAMMTFGHTQIHEATWQEEARSLLLGKLAIRFYKY